jgi:two-component system sensor histidine kinase EvgS
MIKILIVEDRLVWRKLIAHLLAPTEVVLTFTQNGKLAVEAIQWQHHYDAIVMNVKMPVMDGYEATRRIRKLGFKNPIIGNSGLHNSEDIQLAFDSGMSHYLLRTGDFEDLRGVLHHLDIVKCPKKLLSKWDKDCFFIKEAF